MLLSVGILVTSPRSISAISFKPSLAEEINVVVLMLALRYSLTKANLTCVSRSLAVPLGRSLILACSGVDSGMSIVKLNETFRPMNCHMKDR